MITLPTVEDQIYTVNDPQDGYEVEEFGNDMGDYCPLTYTIQYD